MITVNWYGGVNVAIFIDIHILLPDLKFLFTVDLTILTEYRGEYFCHSQPLYSVPRYP